MKSPCAMLTMRMMPKTSARPRPSMPYTPPSSTPLTMASTHSMRDYPRVCAGWRHRSRPGSPHPVHLPMGDGTECIGSIHGCPVSPWGEGQGEGRATFEDGNDCGNAAGAPNQLPSSVPSEIGVSDIGVREPARRPGEADLALKQARNRARGFERARHVLLHQQNGRAVLPGCAGSRRISRRSRWGLAPAKSRRRAGGADW